MDKRVILFNAPAGVGKDMICDFLTSQFKDSEKLEFKAPVIAIAKVLYSITDKEWEANYTRENKEKPFRGLEQSLRDILITVSEEFVKPFYGRDVFGRVTAEKIIRSPKTNFFLSDCGFDEEVECVGRLSLKQKPLLFRIYRNGFGFDGDSRDYIKDEKVSSLFKVVDIDNEEGKIEEFKAEVLKIINEYFGVVE